MAQKNTRTEESLERHVTRIEELLVAHPFSGLPLKEVGSMGQVAREYSAISKLERGRAKVGAEAISSA
jgi:hypothetical protein